MAKHYAADPAFYNGVEYLRKKVLDRLSELKGKAIGNERFMIGMLIDEVKRME